MCNENFYPYPHSLYPTSLAYNPPDAVLSSRFGYAGAALLPTITITEKNRLAWAILDSGASSTFLLSDAPVKEKTEAINPIDIRLPDGNHVSSSHKALLDLPQLSRAARIFGLQTTVPTKIKLKHNKVLQ